MVTDVGANAIGVIALIGDDDGSPVEAIKEWLGVDDIVVVSGGDQEADRAAFRVDPRVDLRREASSASPHTTISTLFFTPEAC